MMNVFNGVKSLGARETSKVPDCFMEQLKQLCVDLWKTLQVFRMAGLTASELIHRLLEQMLLKVTMGSAKNSKPGSQGRRPGLTWRRESSKLRSRRVNNNHAWS